MNAEDMLRSLFRYCVIAYEYDKWRGSFVCLLYVCHIIFIARQMACAIYNKYIHVYMQVLYETQYLHQDYSQQSDSDIVIFFYNSLSDISAVEPTL